MATILSQVPANYLKNILVTNPTVTSFIVGGISYSRASVLAQYNGVEDPSENNSPVLGLQSIPMAPKVPVKVRADVH